MRYESASTKLKQFGVLILLVPTPWALGVLTSLYLSSENTATIMQGASVIILALFAPLIIGILITPNDKGTEEIRSLERRVIFARITRTKSLTIIIATLVAIPFVVGADTYSWIEAFALGYWSFVMVILFSVFLNILRWPVRKYPFILGYFSKKIEPDATKNVAKSITERVKIEVGDYLEFEGKMAAWVELWRSSRDQYAYPADIELFGFFCRDVESFLASKDERKLRVTFLVIQEFSTTVGQRTDELRLRSESLPQKVNEWLYKLEEGKHNMHGMSDTAYEKLAQTKEALEVVIRKIREARR